jgi:hypothetical protein
MVKRVCTIGACPAATSTLYYIVSNSSNDPYNSKAISFAKSQKIVFAILVLSLHMQLQLPSRKLHRGEPNFRRVF